MHDQIYIGLGSNLSSQNDISSAQQIEQALLELNNTDGVEVIARSSLYCSSPMGPQNQPDYINAVAQLRCKVKPEALLDILQQVEQNFGRERNGERWGPRTLDLDILLFDQHTIKSKRLTVPHYGLAEREFVLVPLFELAPEMIMPDGRPIAAWVANVSLNGLRRLPKESQDKD